MFKKFQYIFILTVGLFCIHAKSIAQEINIKTWLDTTMVLIGDQINYHIEITKNRSVNVNIPEYIDTIAKGIEVIDKSKIDTTFLTADLLKLEQSYLVTSFDSGFHIIPPKPFAFSGNGYSDTLYSQPLYLGVLTFQIDSVKGIVDIKPPKETPFTFSEAWPYVYWSLLGLVLLAGIFFAYQRFVKREKVRFVPPPPKIPAHRLALDELDQLERKKLWQQGKVKQYHSELTEIIRRYLENRFGILALEQTSDEIMDDIRNKKLTSPEVEELLSGMFHLADFVKFAKLQPTPDANEKGLKDAFDIVLKTKVKEDLTQASKHVKENPDTGNKTVYGADTEETKSHESQIKSDKEGEL